MPIQFRQKHKALMGTYINIATLENIALCCVGCNASKGAKPLQLWLESENAKRRGITEETLSEVVKQALANLPS